MSAEPNNSIDWEQQRGHVNLDLLRENAELRTNVAGLEERAETFEWAIGAKDKQILEFSDDINEKADAIKAYMADVEALTARNARMREALQACRKWVRAPHSETAAGSMNMPIWEADMKLVVDALTESPAASLAAIQDAAKAGQKSRDLEILRHWDGYNGHSASLFISQLEHEGRWDSKPWPWKVEAK